MTPAKARLTFDEAVETKQPAIKHVSMEKQSGQKIATTGRASATDKKAKPSPFTGLSKAMLKTVDHARTAVYGHLGIYGFVVDSASDNIQLFRSSLPQVWGALVARGKQVEIGVKKHQLQVVGRVNEYSIERDIKQTGASMVELATGLKQRLKR